MHFEESTSKIQCFNLQYSFESFEARVYIPEPSLFEVRVHGHKNKIWLPMLLHVKNSRVPALIGDDFWSLTSLEDGASHFFYTANLNRKILCV